MPCCPSCQENVPNAVNVCPTCGWNLLTPPGKIGPSIAKSATRPKIQCEVDLGVTVDRTGSSEKFEKGIPMAFEMVLANLTAKVRSTRVWLASHGDLDCGQEFLLHTDAGSPDQAIAEIKKIKSNGGGDPAEHHLDAIEALLNRVPWTADPSRARGAILAFMTADTKPAKSGITATELGKQIQDRGILFYLVCEPTPTLQELANAAGGLVFQITNNPDPADLQKIAAEVGKSIAASVAAGSTVPATN